MKGVIVPLLSLDKEDMIKLLNHVSCVDYVFVLGSTGEFDKKTDEEKEEIVKIAKEHSKNPVLVGCCDNNSNKVIENINKFASVSVVSPNPDENVEEFYDKILENTRENIILYNNPHNPAIKQPIPLELIEKLSKNKKVIAIKDSSEDMEFFKQVLKLKSENFSVLQGSDPLLTGLKLGADGIVPSLANVYPQLLIDLYNKREESLQDEYDSHMWICEKEDAIASLKEEVMKVLKWK